MSGKTAKSVIGILALQGDFAAHRRTLESLPDVKTISVRTPSELDLADGLVLPGGESTTIAKLLGRSRLMEPLRARLRAGMPAYGTCAGMILLANTIANRPDQPTVGGLDATVDRNAFGRQVDSFEADICFKEADGVEKTVRGVFIRAPYVQAMGGGVEVLSRFEDRIVAVKQGAILATAFHPELTGDNTVHRYFASMVKHSKEKR